MDVGDDLRDEARLEPNTDALRGPFDRRRELILRWGGDCDHPRAQQFAELRVPKRMVEEVGTQREHYVYARASVGGERGETV